MIVGGDRHVYNPSSVNLTSATKHTLPDIWPLNMHKVDRLLKKLMSIPLVWFLWS